MGAVAYVVEDFLGIVQLFSDGSIKRSHENIDFTPFPVQDDGSVDWKDYSYDNHHDLRLRIYKPKSTTTSKLPVIYFLHGGGFCVGSFAWPNFHNCCLRLSSGLHAIVVAPDYRLAPEHRLPAALEDSYGALKWIQTMATKDGGHGETFDRFDFDRFFVTGDSSGGNIAHYLAVRLGPGSPELSPVKIRGYVMLAPFFGGTERTKSEVEGSLTEKFLTLELLDMFWRMSLPVGKTADHSFANPFGPNSPSLELVKLDPILIMVGGNEIMKDRVKVYADRLKKLGKIASYVEFEGKQHGFFSNEPYSDVSESVLNLIKDFVSQQSSN
uniref:probable carboxylesterase 15 n=1 Tax=Erigeron canadensis TaxID=72917 RepID=UPI001CB98EA9|nr:probable carboxylesterase 15 [Erigeron canadensis]